MAQISSIGPSPDPQVQSSAIKGGFTNSAQKNTSTAGSSNIQSDETQSSPLQAQLTRLSSVLNGLQQNASATRAQYVQAYNKVKSGTYSVDSSDISKSLVDDMLTNH